MSPESSLRERAERAWAVSVDRAAPAGHGVRKIADDLGEQVRRARAEARAEELEERVLRLERRLTAGSAELPARTLATTAGGTSRFPQTPSTGPLRGQAPSAPAAAPPVFDYFAFESRMRGPRDEIRLRQAAYVDDFRGAKAAVLDAGCGRGEFLRLLREAGIDAYGVDANADMVAFCAGEGLAVDQADVVAHLESLEPATLGGIFAAQLVEHLPRPALVRFLELAARALRPGAPLVAETINPLTLTALGNYFADLTHAQPLVPDTLVLLARGAGFESAEVRFLNEPGADERLRDVELPPEPAFDEARRALAVDIARLNDLLYGPLDSALVARQ